MEERQRFAARALEGEQMSFLRRESGILRKTGHTLASGTVKYRGVNGKKVAATLSETFAIFTGAVEIDIDRGAVIYVVSPAPAAARRAGR